MTITGPDVNHIRNVLRMKPGEELSVRTGADEREYRYGIEEILEDRVVCRLRFIKESDVELPARILLFQGLPKADKMEWIVQKAVELGVAEIIPVEMKRCVVRLDPAKGAKKAQRWQTIAEAAAKQSRRAYIPQVLPPMTMQEAAEYAEAEADLLLLPYEQKETDESTAGVLSNIRRGQTIAVFIGPEGGFEPDEVESLRQRDAAIVSLGRRILRTETAGLTVLSWMIYLLEIAGKE